MNNNEIEKKLKERNYPKEEDIYNMDKKEEDINPSDLSTLKTPNMPPNEANEKDLDDDFSGNDLDVPGSELDDENEEIGSEDEENNSYSICGDRHSDLDENHDE